MTEFTRSVMTKERTITFKFHPVQLLSDKKYFVEIKEAYGGQWFCEVRFDKEKKLWVFLPPVADEVKKYEPMVRSLLKDNGQQN